MAVCQLRYLNSKLSLHSVPLLQDLILWTQSYPHKHMQYAILFTIQGSKSAGMHVACLRDHVCNETRQHLSLLYSICMCSKGENQLRFPVLVAPPQEVHGHEVDQN